MRVDGVGIGERVANLSCSEREDGNGGEKSERLHGQ